MTEPPPQGPTGETIRWEDVPTLMRELRAMAQSLLRRESRAESLQPTALVMSALRRQRTGDMDWSEVRWDDRRAFFGCVHRAMRQALVDHARARSALKRAVKRTLQVDQIHLNDLAQTAEEQPEVVHALDLALSRLEAEHPERAELVEHRFFSGLTLEETGEMLGVGERTVRRWWTLTRLWLYDEILKIVGQE